MPWSETCAMDERMRFIVAASEDEAVMSEICAEFGISRQTGYKWLGRYRAEGAEGLKERSRAPVHHGRARDEELVAAALALRERTPPWGPKKLRQKLCGRFSEEPAPARSTIGDWLRKEGLTQLRRPRRRCPPFSSPLQSGRGAQRRLVRRLQGLVSDRRQAALRSADAQRREQPLFPALPGRDANGRGACAA